jgi:2-polyprenyl-3-methyl-5-hydroxy-6-metoxy-1,4-benzoquinol methylase
MKTSIFDSLERLQLTSFETRTKISNRTRDIDDLSVWKDNVSGVIYIDDFYTGEETYLDGAYRKEDKIRLQAGKLDYEEISDANRRFKANLRFVAGKKLLDFGCGNGDFLRLVNSHCAEVCGVELQKDYINALHADGISCENSLDSIPSASVDICVSFHVIEHLPNPLETLKLLKDKILPGGMILVEVPHAKDFLLSTLNNEDFKNFSLWSQHLILHTRESLHKMLDYAGFKKIQIEGVQRYPISNHLNWLVNGKGGGHKSQLSLVDSPSLKSAYSNSLARMDATDTLVAIAKVPHI